MIEFFIMLLLGSSIGIIIYKMTKRKQKKAMEEERHIPYGPYEAILKRPIDFFLSGIALILFFPILIVISILVRIKLGSPVVFIQYRPGLNEKIFRIHKFRSMEDLRNKNGELLQDEIRLTDFGKKLRETSLDELLELFDIFVGNLSIVGPRPQLVKDMVFMNKNQRKRHDVRPGLTGLAQINGRNAITWEEKLNYDMEYIKKITFLDDMKILLKTVKKVMISKEGITEAGMATAIDYGDYLLAKGSISMDTYVKKQEEATVILERTEIKIEKV